MQRLASAEFIGRTVILPEPYHMRIKVDFHCLHGEVQYERAFQTRSKITPDKHGWHGNQANH